jgi:hypothetical protein
LGKNSQAEAEPAARRLQVQPFQRKVMTTKFVNQGESAISAEEKYWSLAVGKCDCVVFLRAGPLIGPKGPSFSTVGSQK